MAACHDGKPGSPVHLAVANAAGVALMLGNKPSSSLAIGEQPSAVACGPEALSGAFSIVVALPDGDVQLFAASGAEIAQYHAATTLADVVFDDGDYAVASDGVDSLRAGTISSGSSIQSLGHQSLTFPAPMRLGAGMVFPLVALSPVGSDARHSALSLLPGTEPQLPAVFPIPRANAMTVADFDGDGISDVVALVQTYRPLMIFYRTRERR
jgi:hypothetical protein